MKEHVLLQIVDDYLQFKGYFTTHDVRFRPRRAVRQRVGSVRRSTSGGGAREEGWET